MIANLNAEAWENFQSKNYHLALPLFSKSFGLSENQDARLGLILSHLRLGNCDTVIALTAKALQDTTIAYPLLKLYRGDAYWMKGNLEAARTDYRQLYQAHLSLNVDEAVLKRLETLQLSDVQLKMQKYFVGDKDETVRVLMLKEVLEQHPTFDVGKLMLGEMLSEKREYQHSLHYLQRIQATLANEFLEAMKEKIVGNDCFYLKDFPNARAHFQKALEFVHSQALLNEVQDCIERCDWMMASKNDGLIL